MYVYLIGSYKHKWFKIGRSSNASVRLSDLGILLPFKVHVVAVWKTEAYKALEKKLHEQYADYRINGEWFRFGKGMVKQITEDLSYLAADTASSFTNINYRETTPFLLTPEECERRKQESIKLRADRPTCPTCGHKIKKACA